MNISGYISAVTGELAATLAEVSEAEVEAFMRAIRNAGNIFVAGAGRSRLMICGFAMRLMQTGYRVYVVGEVVTPAITADDLLIIASGSGETGTLTVLAAKARELGAKLGVITIFPHSVIGESADVMVRIPAQSSKQPGASLFEQSVLLLCDAMVFALNPNNPDEVNAGLMKRHANLE